MRAIGYGRTRPDLPADCPERFDLAFLRYVRNFPHNQRPRIVVGIVVSVVTCGSPAFTTTAEVDGFLSLLDRIADQRSAIGTSP